MSLSPETAVPVTVYRTPPAGVSAWHRHWVQGQIAGAAAVDCTGCAAPCCTHVAFIPLYPEVDDIASYATQPMPSGGVGLQQRDDGSCVYFVDGRCSIHARRPSACRTFDCRIYAMLPDNDVMDEWWEQGPARAIAQRLRDTASSRFPFTIKEPADRSFYQRFLEVFWSLQNKPRDWEMCGLLATTLLAMTDARTIRRVIAACGQRNGGRRDSDG